MKNKFKRDDRVIVNSFTPPQEGTVMDSYVLPLDQVYDDRLFHLYKNNGGVPIVEVVLDNSGGKLSSFSENVVEKA